MGSFSSRVASAVLGRPDACVGGGVNQYYESRALWEGAEAHAEFVERAFGISVGLPYQDAAWLMAVALRPDLIRRYLDAQGDAAGEPIAASYERRAAVAPTPPSLAASPWGRRVGWS
ncbi:MAG: hypothetical protein FJ290_11850 [Planctomycetes bacterium]|nr:hypothetical protein [Planctomycetota bacterium]